MIGPHIRDGDIVVLEHGPDPRPSAEHGNLKNHGTRRLHCIREPNQRPRFAGRGQSANP